MSDRKVDGGGRGRGRNTDASVRELNARVLKHLERVNSASERLSSELPLLLAQWQ